MRPRRPIPPALAPAPGWRVTSAKVNAAALYFNEENGKNYAFGRFESKFCAFSPDELHCLGTDLQNGPSTGVGPGVLSIPRRA